MLDHMILTVSDVERSLAFYEAALKPLNDNGTVTSCPPTSANVSFPTPEAVRSFFNIGLHQSL